MVLTVPLIIFMDYVSGNVSKQWNKHYVVYMSNASVPCEMLEKEFYNPMQAEEYSHGGLKCNYFCWTCQVGGTNVEKRMDRGYTNLFICGELWTPERTLAEVKEKIKLSMLLGGATKIKAEVSKTGTPDAATASIIEHLLELGKCLRKCKTETAAIPENEICQTVYILDKANFLGIFQIYLDSVETGGLGSTTLRADYIVCYEESLIEWHFKSLAQVMPYLIYDLVPQTVLDDWSTIEKLVVLLWHTTIEDTETYLGNSTKEILSLTIEDFLSLSAQCAPSILFIKAKFHFLLHLPMFSRQFFPAILFSTERYGSFNHVFLLASHIVTGGYWKDPTTMHWIKTGNSVLEYRDKNPEQQHLIGLSTTEPKSVGATHLPTSTIESKSRKFILPIKWQTTLSAKLIKGPLLQVNEDKSDLGSYVIFKHGNQPCVGKVVEILSPHKHPNTASYIAISKLDFLLQIHPQLHVLCMKFTVPDVKIVVLSMDVLCTVNVHHDCFVSALTTRTKDLVSHSPTNTFLLNTHALHIYQHLAAVIPPSFHSQFKFPLITDHETIYLNAAKAVCAKKAPAFDRAKWGPKGKGKSTVTKNTQLFTSSVPPSIPPNPILVLSPTFTATPSLPNLHPTMHY
ncbi:hypothetical protein V8B97DRAFT_2022606 [Scleroderma yunnanense]